MTRSVPRGCASALRRAVAALLPPHTVPVRHALPSQPLTFEFHGRSTHAAGSPSQGRSALAAVVQLFVAVDSLRQFLPDMRRVAC
jgi:metal-dependent amidase/aminoacylase/carboxypeptidase family protein